MRSPERARSATNGETITATREEAAHYSGGTFYQLVVSAFGSEQFYRLFNYTVRLVGEYSGALLAGFDLIYADFVNYTVRLASSCSGGVLAIVDLVHAKAVNYRFRLAHQP